MRQFCAPQQGQGQGQGGEAQRRTVVYCSIAVVIVSNTIPYYRRKRCSECAAVRRILSVQQHGGVCLQRALSPAPELHYFPVCSAVLLCVFDIPYVYWVQHWYCCNAARSFSVHTYLPSCSPLGHRLGQEPCAVLLIGLLICTIKR